MSLGFSQSTADSIPIFVLTPDQYHADLGQLPVATPLCAKMMGFEAKPGHYLLVGSQGGLQAVILIEKAERLQRDPFCVAQLVDKVPAGKYRLVLTTGNMDLSALAWLLASYQFDRFKKSIRVFPKLVAPSPEGEKIERQANAIAYGRDLINRPANDLGPDALEFEAQKLAQEFETDFRSVSGEALIAENFPLVYAVGKGAQQAPRLVQFCWGNPSASKITLVGKGVCFDSGGLDIKPSSSMLLMKKDMGGAAVALTLAKMIMQAALNVRLKVIVPIVENSISASSMRPGDIYRSRRGSTVEIGNTDAEGRLILADALTYAQEDSPDYLFDFATLTGAARVALGPDLPPFFTDCEELAQKLLTISHEVGDPLWRLPLWENYQPSLESKYADLNNIGGGVFAGSIVAALFLKRFVTCANWVHIDLYGWNPVSKPGRPEGGEPQSARAVFHFLEQKFGTLEK